MKGGKGSDIEMNEGGERKKGEEEVGRRANGCVSSVQRKGEPWWSEVKRYGGKRGKNLQSTERGGKMTGGR